MPLVFRPSKTLGMSLTNSSPLTLAQYAQAVAANSQTSISLPQGGIALNKSMIMRIHNVRPGCGSCGK